MTTKQDTMTTDDVMALFHITRRTVYRWIEYGKLAPERAGRRLLFKRADVMALLRREG